MEQVIQTLERTLQGVYAHTKGTLARLNCFSDNSARGSKYLKLFRWATFNHLKWRETQTVPCDLRR